MAYNKIIIITINNSHIAATEQKSSLSSHVNLTMTTHSHQINGEAALVSQGYSQHLACLLAVCWPTLLTHS